MFAVNTRLLGRSSGRLVNSTRPSTLPQCPRHASTAAKPRATKKTVTTGEEAPATTKKSLSTKTPATTSTRAPRKKANATASDPLTADAAATTPKKSTRVASTKTTIATPKKAAEAKTTSAATKPAATVSAQSRPSPARPVPLAGKVAPKPPTPVDTNSPEYKAAARKWTSLMVALPVLAVSSYFLFDRIILGNEPKGLEALRKKTAEARAPAEPGTSPNP